MGITDSLVAAALAEGAAKAEGIEQGRIVLSASFRDICATNACGKYGRCYMCPPDVGEIEELIAMVRRYPRAVVYQTISPLEDSFDHEGMVDASANHAQLSQRLQKKAEGILAPGFLHLSCGGCRLCDPCLKQEGLPCRYPDQALPSVESYGIDVYNTVKDTSLKYINGQNTVTYFGMLLFDEAED